MHIIKRGKLELISILIIIIALGFAGACGKKSSSKSSAGSSAAPAAPATGWATASAIETPGGAGIGSGNAQVAMNTSGNAVAVWTQSDSSRDNIVANYYTAGVGWALSTPAFLEATNTQAETPQVAMDNNGNAIAVWSQDLGLPRFDICACKFSNGSWGSVIILSNGLTDCINPRVAMDNNGNVMVVWLQNSNVWNSYSTDAGTSWNAPNNMQAGGGDSISVQVAINANGNAIVVWSQFDATRNNILSQSYYLPTGSWGVEQPIENNPGNANTAHVAVASNGNACAVWLQTIGTTYSIWANNYITGTGWSTAGAVEFGNLRDAQAPQVGVASNGDAIAVWYEYDGTRNNIWANLYVSGTGWAGAALLETVAGDAVAPKIAMNADGTAFVVWEQNDGSNYRVYSRRYIAGTGWEAAQMIESVFTENSDFPAVAINASGKAVAVWPRCLDGLVWNIWANIYR